MRSGTAAPCAAASGADATRAPSEPASARAANMERTIVFGFIPSSLASVVWPRPGRCFGRSVPFHLRPANLDALAGEMRLELRKTLWGFAHTVGRQPPVEAVGCEETGDLADVPFDRVQPVAAVGDVRGADILAGRRQVRHAPRQERAEGYLERAGPDVDVVVAPRRGVKIDAVHPDPHRVRVVHSAALAADRQGEILL